MANKNPSHYTNSLLSTSSNQRCGLSSNGPLRTVSSPHHRAVPTAIHTNNVLVASSSKNNSHISVPTASSQSMKSGIENDSNTKLKYRPHPSMIDHPLATPLPSTQTCPSNHTVKTPTKALPPSTTTTIITTPPRTIVKTIKPSPKPVSKLDAEVDYFLSAKRTPTIASLLLVDSEEPGPLPLLKPPPLPQRTGASSWSGNRKAGITELRELEKRRAWLDVLHRGFEMLTLSSSPYEAFYSAFIHKTDFPSNDQNNSDIDNDSKAGKSRAMIFILDEFVQILQLRLNAMVKLRRFEDLEREINRLSLNTTTTSNNNNTDSHNHNRILKFHSNDDSLMELLLDSVAAMQYAPSIIQSATTTAASNCIDSLLKLRPKLPNVILRIKCNMQISNLFVKERDIRMGLLSLDDILSELQDFSNEGLLEEDQRNLCYAKTEVYSRQGRILLQVGALPAAAIIFERAQEELKKTGEDECGHDSNHTMSKCSNRGRTQISINEGLLYFSHTDYNMAEDRFSDAIRLQLSSDNNGVDNDRCAENERQTRRRTLNSNTRLTTIADGLGMIAEELLTPALNNMALCALYTCRMSTAVDLLEGLVRENPTRYLTECTIFNLCTLYELGSNNDISERKKRVLQLLAKRFSLHDVGVDCFRLS